MRKQLPKSWDLTGARPEPLDSEAAIAPDLREGWPNGHQMLLPCTDTGSL